ncbi:hypothetical protein VNO80_05762 [Phaseolus coccineus]|uniref:Uncharacterized protein n=1 Tax=Phaseolus coccineus TaxID=3886 RepID=A0AAN9NKU3_PHACN
MKLEVETLGIATDGVEPIVFYSFVSGFVGFDLELNHVLSYNNEEDNEGNGLCPICNDEAGVLSLPIWHMYCKTTSCKLSRLANGHHIRGHD